jgi:hypothetical protein
LFEWNQSHNTHEQLEREMKSDEHVTLDPVKPTKPA